MKGIDKKTLLKQARHIFFIFLFSSASGFIFCPSCYQSFEYAKLFTIYTGLIWTFLWKGNEYINYRLDKNLTWLEAPAKRFRIGSLWMFIYTVTATFTINSTFFLLFKFPLTSFRGFILSCLAAIIFTTLIASFLSAKEFLSAWRESALLGQKYREQLLSAQYEALKNQVNPHFLFNSLNVLSELVYISADQSADFIKKLADVYRYVLDSREKEFVPLEEELKFLESYIFLQKIRHGDNLKISIDKHLNKQGHLPPLTLQLLFENAVKHNIVSEESPLAVELYYQENYLVVKNNLQKKKIPEQSSGIGLENLKARYQYFAGDSVIIDSKNGSFVVKIPLILLND